jgi:hypothetical protein
MMGRRKLLHLTATGARNLAALPGGRHAAAALNQIRDATLLHIYQSDVNINNLVLLYKNISTPIKQLRNCKFAVCIAYSTYVSYAYAKEKKPTC